MKEKKKIKVVRQRNIPKWKVKEKNECKQNIQMEYIRSIMFTEVVIALLTLAEILNVEYVKNLEWREYYLS